MKLIWKEVEPGVKWEAVQTHWMSTFKKTAVIYSNGESQAGFSYNVCNAVFAGTATLEEAKTAVETLFLRWGHTVLSHAACFYDTDGDGDCQHCAGGKMTCPNKEVPCEKAEDIAAAMDGGETEL